MRLTLSRLALGDIDLIHDFTLNEWGEVQALKYINALWDALEEIGAVPERWRLRPEIHPDCRACVCGRHLIIYRVHNGCVEVSRILHGSADLPAHLPERFMAE